MHDELINNQIKQIQGEIKEYIEALSSLSCQENLHEQSHFDFCIFLAKHIVFFKMISSVIHDRRYNRLYNLVISDLLSLSFEITRNEQRYIYLNERSLIESFMRIITKCDGRVKGISPVFLQLQEISKNLPVKVEYDLIKSEYAMASNYIHGNVKDTDTLSLFLEDCIRKKGLPSKKIKQYFQRLVRVIVSFDRMLINQQVDQINEAFYRKSKIMQYLIGKDQVDFYFSIRNNRLQQGGS